MLATIARAFRTPFNSFGCRDRRLHWAPLVCKPGCGWRAFSWTLRHTCWQRRRRCCAEPTVGPPRAELLRKNRMDSKGRYWVKYKYTSGARPFLTAVRATPGVSNRKARLHPGFSHLLTLSDVMSMLPYQLPHLPDHVEGSSGDARDKRESFQDAIQQI